VAEIIVAFAPMFVHHSWRHAHILLVGAIVTPGRRAMTSVLRIMRRAQMWRFVNDCRILDQAAWYPCSSSHILAGLLVDVFVQRDPVVLCLDDKIERRWGPRIKARGIYCDPVCSSVNHIVIPTELRWMSLMLLTSIP
jgi:hypothetical protein